MTPLPPARVANHGLAPLLLSLAALAAASPAWSHDIPNQRVDRSIQATLEPGTLRIDYEVSLSELTLTQDLRALIGSLPGADRSEWFNRYGEVTGPLNAKGFLVTCDGRPVVLNPHGFDLVVEEHPRYTFHFTAPVAASGHLTIQDTNYVSSEGTSRLALRGSDGVRVEGDDLPSEVDEIPIRPVWQLDDAEERRTKRVEVRFHGPAVAELSASRPAAIPGEPEPVTVRAPRSGPEAETNRTVSTWPPTEALSGLLDRRNGLSWLGLMALAAGLGAIHAVQPGHGKTLVSAIALGPGTRWYQLGLLGLLTTATHTGSVLLIAALLWWTGASEVARLHLGLTRLAGFAIAAGGLWRVGRSLCDRSEREYSIDPRPMTPSLGGLISLGIAGGLVPCWDAVALVILSAAIDRLDTGIQLVVAFGVGMAVVLVGVGMLVGRLRSTLVPASGRAAWGGYLTLTSGLMLAALGLVFFLR